MSNQNFQILQGDFKVSSNKNVVFSAFLGSCVSACIWDPINNIGGMNHILLPEARGSEQVTLSQGTNAMEVLINGIIRAGGDPNLLRVKLLGGAKMYDGVFDVGRRNAEFAKWFVTNEGLPLVDTCLGGNLGRNIRFWPATGKVQRKFMQEIVEFGRTGKDVNLTNTEPNDGEVELF